MRTGGRAWRHVGGGYVRWLSRRHGGVQVLVWYVDGCFSPLQPPSLARILIISVKFQSTAIHRCIPTYPASSYQIGGPD